MFTHPFPKKPTLLSITTLVLLSFITLIPYLSSGQLFSGIDMSFHLSRVYEVAENLRQGNPFSYISTYSLNQVGTPINMVYGALPVYIIAVPFCLISDHIIAVYVGIWLLIIISLILNYWVSVQYWKGDNLKALLFTFIYVISVYNFNSLFHTFDLGQAFSLAFLPLIAYGTHSLFFNQKRDWQLLAIGMTGVIYTHVLSTLLYATVVVIISLFGFCQVQDKWASALNLAKAVLVTLLCTLAFWITLLKTVTSTNLNITMDISVASANLTVGNFLLEILDSTSVIGMGLIIIIPTVIGFLSWFKLSRTQKIIGTLGITYCLLATNVFNLFWNFLDLTPFRMIQWPNRFVTIGFFFLVIFSTEIISQLFRRNTIHLKLKYGLAIATTLFLVLSSSYTFINASKNFHPTNYQPTVQHPLPFLQYRIPNSKSLITLVSGYNTGVGSTDYWPSSSIPVSQDIRDHLAIINNRSKRKTIPKSIPNGVIYHVKSRQSNQLIDLPFLNYFDYQLTINGTPAESSQSARGTLTTTLVKGLNTIKIKYHPDLGILLAQYLSFLMTLLLIIVLLTRPKQIATYRQQ